MNRLMVSEHYCGGIVTQGDQKGSLCVEDKTGDSICFSFKGGNPSLLLEN